MPSCYVKDTAPTLGIHYPTMTGIGTEVSGLSAISETDGESLPAAGSVSITIGSDLTTQKSTLSEGAMLLEIKRAKMASVRKRNGMKVVFRVRASATCLLGSTSGLPAKLHSGRPSNRIWDVCVV